MDISLNSVVGFVLALLFAIVMGVSMQAVLVGDYLQSQAAMSQSMQNTLRIAGFAGALAALVAWWAQNFAANRGLIVRVLFALFVFVLAFCSFGGLLRVINSHLTYPNQQDWSLSGLYFASINDFYAFVLSLLGPALPAYVGLVVVAGLFIGLFGPKAEQV